MTGRLKDEANFSGKGYAICKNAIAPVLLGQIKREMIAMGRALTGRDFSSVDACWNYLTATDRALGGAFYNGFKRLPSVYQAAVSDGVLAQLRDVAGMQIPALVDVNCRIDSKDEDKYLFDWHQDYWFSVCSPDAVVVWIPVEPIHAGTGSLEIISNEWTNGRVFATRAGNAYNSYADAVVLDDEIPTAHAQSVTGDLSSGDALLFKFSMLHRSEAVSSSANSRFTIQLRFADMADAEFRRNFYKPGVVNSSQVDFLKKEDQK
ncbi:Phytanoyl-CoA dioxygenase [Burkholderiaceae bacterium]